MTQVNKELLSKKKKENKELLLKDLCCRLPYSVKVQNQFGGIDRLVLRNADLIRLYYDDFRIYSERNLSLPYLLPLSSMTKEQEKEWSYTLSSDYNITYDTIDWLNKNHFDYRGLIEKGLAIDATGLNIY